MKKKRLLVLAGVICVALMLVVMPLIAACAKPAPAPTPAPAPAPTPAPAPPPKPITLKTGSWMPEGHVTSEIMRFWAEQVTEKTGGRVQFEHFYAGALGKGPEQLDNIKNGVFDIGPFLSFWSPAKTPLWTVYAGPKVSSEDPYARFMIFWDLAELPAMKDELTQWDSMLLFPYALADINHVWTVDKPIHTLDDLDGLSIRDTGLKAKAISLVGVNPVAMLTTETYDALAKGVVDGHVNADASVLAYKLYEVAKYKSTLVTGMGGPLWLIRLSVFNKLPADIQKIMMDVSHEDLATYFANKEAEFLSKAEETFKKAGVIITEIPKEEQARYEYLAVKPIMEEWIKNMEDKGLPGREVYWAYLDAALKYEKK